MAHIYRHEVPEPDRSSEELRLKNVDHIASYSWIKLPHIASPAIVVPGYPATWKNKKGRQRVNKDSGWVVIAANEYNHPDSPLEPLFRSVAVMRPDFQVKKVDIISDRNCFRKLLNFLEPSFSKYSAEPAIIDLETVGNTVIFARKEKANRDFIPPSEFRGFGHEYEKANTTDMYQDRLGHHRIVAYRLNDLNILLRYEVDACVETAAPDPTDELAIQMNDLRLAPPEPTSKLRVVRGGMVVAPSSTLEIKTRVAHKPMSVADVAPQLWFSDTSKLVRAYHERGVFSQADVVDVSESLKDWQKNNQRALKRFVHLLGRIKAEAAKCGRQARLTIDSRDDCIIITKTPTEKCKSLLPQDLYKIWT